jgi:hypothetical protein
MDRHHHPEDWLGWPQASCQFLDICTPPTKPDRVTTNVSPQVPARMACNGKMVARYNATLYPKECQSCQHPVKDQAHFLRCNARSDWRRKFRNSLRNTQYHSRNRPNAHGNHVGRHHPMADWDPIPQSAPRNDNFPTNLVRYVAILMCYKWQWTWHHLAKGSCMGTIWPRRHNVCLIMPTW